MQPADLVIDGRQVHSETAFYIALSSYEGIPDWIGHNLDALWDTVTALIDHPLDIYWRHADVSAETMGTAFDSIVNVLREAEIETAARPDGPRFRLHLITGIQ